MYVKNHGSGDRWLSGIIISVLCPVTYDVELLDGRIGNVIKFKCKDALLTVAIVMI